MSEFIIPINRNDLLSRNFSNNFHVEKVANVSALGVHLSECEKELRSKGKSIVREMFDYLYSVLHYWNEIDNKLKEGSWDILLLSCKKLTPAVVEVLNQMNKPSFFHFRNSAKMNVYLICQFIELYEADMSHSMPLLDKGRGKKKKPAAVVGSKLDWPHELQSAIGAINQLFECQINNLWDPPIIEEDFINLVANMCYKLLENPDTCKNTSIREVISKILINLTKRHNHTRLCAIKLVGLLHSFPHTVNCILAICRDFVTANNMSNVLREIVQEICFTYSSSDLEQNNQACNSFTTFLSEFASANPQMIIAVLPHLKDKLHEDPYAMRNCVLSILGDVIIKVYSIDNNQNANRDTHLDLIEEKVIDVNGFVRAKALNILLSIVEANKMPLARQARLMKLLIGPDGAIFDVSSLARKNAMRILTCLTNENPAKGVRYEDLKKNVESEKENLQEMIKKLEQLPESEVVDVQRRIDFIQEQIELQESGQGRRSMTAPIESPEVAREFLNNEIIKTKGVIHIMELCIQFYEGIQSALNDVQAMLSSKVVSDVLEAIHFFVSAKLAGIDNVDSGIRKMLAHICNSDDAIKTAVSQAYRQLYLEFHKDDERDRSTVIVDSLTTLLTEPNYGELMSIEKLIVSFIESKDINEKVVKVLWRRFTDRSLPLTMAQRKGAVVIFSMVAKVPQPYMMSYFQSLIVEGIPASGWASLDLQFVDYLCRSIQNIINAKEKKKNEEPFRLPKEHPLFERLLSLCVSTFGMQHKAYWVPMVNEVLATIYMLAENPDWLGARLVSQLAAEIVSGRKENIGEDENHLTCPHFMLTRLLAVCGEVALKEFVHLDVAVVNELKRRNTIKEEASENKTAKRRQQEQRQRQSTDSAGLEEEIGLAGASADDGEAEYIRALCDNHLISDNWLLLSRLLRLVESVCRTGSRYGNERLLTVAGLSLGKMMLISKREFTDARIALLFDIAKRSPSDVIRANLIVPLGDLIRRFTLQMDVYTPQMYGRLRDRSAVVRLNALTVLSHLILNDMIKVKGCISEMTTCLIDEHPRIGHLARVFFQDLAGKDKALFNVMPDIISRLSDPETGVEEHKFRTIMEYLMPFIQKKNQFENLFDKILIRFNSTTEERAWRDMSYCLSLMNCNDYMIKNLHEKMAIFAGKLHVDEVFNAVNGLINNAEKNVKGVELETMVAEMRTTLKKLRDQNVEDEEANEGAARAMRAQAQRKARGRGQGAWRHHKEAREAPVAARPRLDRTSKRRTTSQAIFSDESGEEEEEEAEARPARGTGRTRRAVIESDEEEEDDDEEEGEESE